MVKMGLITIMWEFTVQYHMVEQGLHIAVANKGLNWYFEA